MQTFLYEVASDLLQKYDNDLSSLTIIFPSLRARTFFNDAIASCAQSPVWQPQWMSIDELMERGANIVRGEQIQLIIELFKVYKKYHPHETLDRFYFWGDMLVRDFDMIDKYRIDAKQLLRNIEEIKELETDVSYLTPEQRRIISFWSSIGSDADLSEQKRQFLTIWRSLPAIYEEYRNHLLKQGIGYPGLIYRTTADRIKRGEAIDFGNRRFIVVGFNALSECEKMLFRYLAATTGGAEFYWDYDSYYVDNPDHEAGVFMRENIKMFGANNSITHNNFANCGKAVNVTACVSNIVQAKHLSEIINQIDKVDLNKNTAIVLTDENMLIPLIHSLPESVGKVNITMGYPLKTTLAYTFVERLLSLQAHSRDRDGIDVFYHVDVSELLTHPYIVDYAAKEAMECGKLITTNKLTSVEKSLFSCHEGLSRIFTKTTDWQSLSKYLIDVLEDISNHIIEQDREQSAKLREQREYMFATIEQLRRTTLSLQGCDIDIPTEVFCSLIRRHLQTTTIPFEGEPLEGVQIMGILETRNIDFKNVIILSMTDANFPGDHTDQASFIPYNLRMAYGMPTPEHHEAMYAYYFYRLIQRAERVEMLYCSRADDKSTGEQSRYIYQLEYESPHKIAKHSVGVDLGLGEDITIEVKKGEQELAMLEQYLGPEATRSLSPTALFRYVQCPLKFYFASIAKLRSPDELSDTIDALTFGNILHNTMEMLYDGLDQVEEPSTEIGKLCNKEVVERAVDATICDILKGYGSHGAANFSGDTLLVRDIIVKYIMQGVMRYDASRTGYRIVGTEKEVAYHYPLSDGRMVALSGRADRIDTLSDDTIQVIDYKTNNRPKLEFDGIYEMFNGIAEKRVSNIFQILLYAMMLKRVHNKESLPTLYYAAAMHKRDYRPEIFDMSRQAYIEKYGDVGEEFEAELTRLLEELFDPEKPFIQVEDIKSCELCEYRKICRR